MIRNKIFVGEVLMIVEAYPFLRWSPTGEMLFETSTNPQLLSDLTDDEWVCREFFRKRANEGLNWIRLLPFGVWAEKEKKFRPFQYEEGVGKWNLAHFSEDYFRIMRRILQIINNPSFPLPNPGDGIKVMFEVHDGCQFRGPYRSLSPWVNNVQSLDCGGFNECLLPKQYDYFRHWLERAFAEFDSLVEVWSFGNEIEDVELTKQITIPFFKSKNMPIERMCFGAVTYSQDPIKTECEQVFSDHTDQGYQDVAAIVIRPTHGFSPEVFQDRMWFSGSPICRATFEDDGCRNGKGRDGRPSADDWYKMIFDLLSDAKWRGNLVHRTRNIPKFFFGHLPEDPLIFDWEGYQQSVAKDMVQAAENATGEQMTNRGKYPTETRPPKPEPEPEKPKPEKKKSWWRKFQEYYGAWHLFSIHKSWFGIPDWWKKSNIFQKCGSFGIFLLLIWAISNIFWR